MIPQIKEYARKKNYQSSFAQTIDANFLYQTVRDVLTWDFMFSNSVVLIKDFI